MRSTENRRVNMEESCRSCRCPLVYAKVHGAPRRQPPLDVLSISSQLRAVSPGDRRRYLIAMVNVPLAVRRS